MCGWREVRILSNLNCKREGCGQRLAVSERLRAQAIVLDKSQHPFQLSNAVLFGCKASVQESAGGELRRLLCKTTLAKAEVLGIINSQCVQRECEEVLTNGAVLMRHRCDARHRKFQ